MGDAFAGLGPEVIPFVTLRLDEQGPTLFGMHGEEVDVVILKTGVATVAQFAVKQREDCSVRGFGALQFPEIDLAMPIVEPDNAPGDVFKLRQARRMAKEVLLPADFGEGGQLGRDGVFLFFARPVSVQAPRLGEQGRLGRLVLDAGIRAHLREVRQIFERDAGREQPAEQRRRRRLLGQALAIPVTGEGDIGKEVDFTKMEAVGVDDPFFEEFFDPEGRRPSKEVVADDPKANDPGGKLFGRQEAAFGLGGVEEDDVPGLELGPLAKQPRIIPESPGARPQSRQVVLGRARHPIDGFRVLEGAQPHLRAGRTWWTAPWPCRRGI